VGGGTVLNEKVKPLLREMGKIVYLEMSVDQLFARVERNGLPPFLRQEDPAAHFAELYRARVSHYKELADITVQVDGMDVAAALDAIRRSLDQHAARGPHQTARP
jgi:shikimate kinase